MAHHLNKMHLLDNCYVCKHNIERVQQKPYGYMNTRKTESYTHTSERIDIGGLEDIFLQLSDLAEDETSHDMEELTAHFIELGEAYNNLSKATGIIGYLESQLDALRDQEKILDDVEKQAERKSELECENREILKALRNISVDVQRAEGLTAANNSHMQKLDQLSGTTFWLYRTFDQFQDIFAGDRTLTMPEYYEMLERSIRNTSV